MEYILTIIAFLLVGIILIGTKILGLMKESLFLIRSKFDADFLRRFDQVYEFMNKKNKFEIKLTKTGKVQKLIKDNRY